MTEELRSVLPALPTAPLPWQKAIWQHLFSQLAHQQMPHAILLHGVKGIGKMALAQLLSATLLCEQALPAQEIYCGKCKSCQLLQHQTHPDLFYIAPFATNAVIKIDQIRELVTDLSQTAQFCGYRVVLIQHAASMNINAANALLKKLEEPGEKTVFILLTDQLYDLPATIRSRCQQIHCQTPTATEAQQWLQTQNHAEITPPMLALANQAPLLALEYAAENFFSLWQKFIDYLQAMLLQGQHPVQVVAELKKMKIDYTVIIEWLLQVVAAVVRLQASHDEKLLRSFANNLTLIEHIATTAPSSMLYQYWDSLLQAQRSGKQKVSINDVMLLTVLLQQLQTMVQLNGQPKV
jgi:DNA polymerase-3 subunit delta'